ncbi:MAG TPA: acyclic terpene utilization AtuA family protein, partial [Actinomycetes bacterium]|nr:acyclic terpene utilization AtuA family protein [Actinomycetes bacterium]
MGVTGRRPVRIANCSGFYGDRLEALAEMVTGGPVDVVTGDYLAEVTMLVLAKLRGRRPGGGYAGSFLRQLEPVAAQVAERGIKVVVNAGGLDPAGLAEATRELLARLGVGLSVAHVEGDDLTGRLPELLAAGHDLAHLDTGAPFRSWGRQALTANAYLGGFGIARALEAGADVVVTGRVADASLTSGVAAWWWGWAPGDHDPLAGAVVAGHVIECGAQATGGNFSWFQEIADLTHPGFPLAEIDQDGSSVITKHPGTGGAVTVDTVTAQLLYEVDGPGYLNPDVVARLDMVRLERVGVDRVRIAGVTGLPPPPTTKVAVTGLGGWRNAATLVLTGLDPDAKAAVAEAAVRARLERLPGITDLRFTRIGVAAADPAEQMAGSCLLQVSVDGDEESAGRAFTAAVVELALANYPGMYGMGPPGAGSAFGAYWPTLVPQGTPRHTVVHSD